MTMILVALFIGAYLLGAIPFGVLITRAKGIDITKVGSGNTGATNVARAIGWRWALVVFMLDLGKGLASSLAARAVHPLEWMWYLVGFAAIAGHCASPFLRFKGGKGIATSLGMVFGASPIVAASGLTVFVILFVLTRWVSLSSIIGVFCAILMAAILRDWIYVGIGTLLFLFVLYTHRANIGRLWSGTEPKFEFKKKKTGDDSEGEP